MTPACVQAGQAALVLEKGGFDLAKALESGIKPSQLIDYACALAECVHQAGGGACARAVVQMQTPAESGKQREGRRRVTCT